MEHRKPKTLVFFLSEDWFFVSHFIKRGIAAKQAGWRVVLLARVSDCVPQIEAAGIEVIPVPFNRKRLNPFAELWFAVQLAGIYRRLQPDLVHNVALKPIIVGGVAARLAGVKAVLNAPVGLGFVFSSDKLLAKILKPMVTLALRLTLSPPNSRVVFENPDDMAAMVGAGMVRPGTEVLIRGAGVDITDFYTAPEPPPPVRVILIARMIREKGIPYFVEAARILRGQAEFILVGAPDPGNPNSATEAELRGWEAEGLVTWLGPRRDIPDLLRGAHIACQPSTYREGLPKSALEAAACGKPLVTTDVPGCREAVVDGLTGFLVPPRDAQALADALKKLIDDLELRARMGAAGRLRTEQEFADAIICEKTLLVYDALTQPRSTP
ncbi:MAG: glycosyl transferase family 1 [Acidocella sp. 20-57-95]|nr:MAG: glycosyl transferase family 1 [Acidocella sp. 20-57-95]OYV59503.1 MAG: glycosyl transferase family 1 [Acidocella sp. 21-58-7]HQT64600.1 glycosyltransferase family 4 protein [Acidocella sp.]HQU04393.1 glycosyltransferase family 4 protein [Acidocella sp.]